MVNRKVICFDEFYHRLNFLNKQEIVVKFLLTFKASSFDFG
jgi:hypothetical protein